MTGKGIGEKPQRTVRPEEGKNILKFVNHHKQIRVPFIIYADFEALNIPVEGCAGDPQKSYTQQRAKQVPCSYCYVVVRSDGVTKTPVLYRCLLYTSPSPRDGLLSRMPSSA